ncbi:hypothetical protein CEXT_10971 [Caerostris extrusa]|uniref:Uncharacterized protein n=1 Tax=Caerostris extrusa TaxID=172846 RepID=A0AAV4NRE2_CAEEX|nr:hypothetical protein CEXT_10971 [Caerostris extrusa]
MAQPGTKGPAPSATNCRPGDGSRRLRKNRQGGCCCCKSWKTPRDQRNRLKCNMGEEEKGGPVRIFAQFATCSKEI